MRLENAYGSKFWSQFSDEKTVALTKREWAENIITHTPAELQYAVETAKSERVRGNKEFDWPDIPKILGLLNNRISPDGHNSSAYLSFTDKNHPEYKHYSKAKRIENSTTVSQRMKKGNNELKNLKGLF